MSEPKQSLFKGGMKCSGCGFLISKLEWEAFKFTPTCPRCTANGGRHPGWIRIDS
jgi:hypothetical protein